MFKVLASAVEIERLTRELREAAAERNLALPNENNTKAIQSWTKRVDSLAEENLGAAIDLCLSAAHSAGPDSQLKQQAVKKILELTPLMADPKAALNIYCETADAVGDDMNLRQQVGEGIVGCVSAHRSELDRSTIAGLQPLLESCYDNEDDMEAAMDRLYNIAPAPEWDFTEAPQPAFGYWDPKRTRAFNPQPSPFGYAA